MAIAITPSPNVSSRAGSLSLVRVGGCHGSRHRRFRGDPPVGLDQVLGRPVPQGGSDVVAPDADRLRESQPQLGVISGTVFLIPQVLQQRLSSLRLFGPRV